MRPSVRVALSVFQSTPPWEGVTVFAEFWGRADNVSIHTPVGGGDAGNTKQSIAAKRFNPHPRGRG